MGTRSVASTKFLSDLEVRVSLCDMQVAQVDCGLRGKKTPVRFLDAVMSAGYHIVDRRVRDSPNDNLQVIDGRRNRAKRLFFSVLAFQTRDFWQRGACIHQHVLGYVLLAPHA